MSSSTSTSTSSSSRQHPHLPPHLSVASPMPAVPIEPSDSRHQAYSFSQNVAGRRGSTDPLLHASLAATANANIHGSNGSPAPSESPFGGSRKRSAASAMLDAANSHGGSNGVEGSSSPSFNNGNGSRFSIGGTHSPGGSSLRGPSDGSMNTLPRLGGPDPSNDRRPSISALTGYNFGSWDPSSSNSFGGSAGPPVPPHASGPPPPPSAAHQGAGPAPDQSGSHASPAYFNGLPTHAPSHHSGAGIAKHGYTPGNGPVPPSASHLSPPDAGADKKAALPYARSPELRVSHKLAERQRRKEMKELFDDLKDLLPNLESDKDKGKISKWEVLSKAIDHINAVNTTQNELIAEVSRCRSQLGLPPYVPPQPPALERGQSAATGSSDPNDAGSVKTDPSINGK